MLSEGIDPDDIRRGMAAWHANPDTNHPSTIPSVVNEVMNGQPRASPNGRQQATDAMFDRQIERARARQEQPR
jgi:hypothetical protein